MWLLEAEACAEQGKTAEAQALLNEVNKPRDPQYNCTKSGDDLINEVRLYTRLELWGEGTNWLLFKRWNMPIDRKAWVEGDPESGNLPSALGVRIDPSNNHGWRFGIPRTERNYNDLVNEPIPGENVIEPEE